MEPELTSSLLLGGRYLIMQDSILKNSAESVSPLLTMPWHLATVPQVEVRWRLLSTFTGLDASRQSLTHHIQVLLSIVLSLA